MHNLRRSPWLLPLLSAALLSAVFRPLGLSWLAFVALVPLYYYVIGAPSCAAALRAGALVGALYSAYLSIMTIETFHWLEHTDLFVWIMHLAIVPVAAIAALVVGGSLFAYRAMRGRHFLLNALLGAATYTLSELVLHAIFGGFYFGMLGDAAVDAPFLMHFASVGGEPFVSFLVVLPSVLIAEALAARRRSAWVQAFAVAAAVALCGVLLGRAYAPGPVVGSFSIASIQAGTREEATFGQYSNGIFSFPDTAARLAAASAGSPELVIYPFSPVEGSIYRGPKDQFDRSVLVVPEDAFGTWLKAHVPGTTTVMTWDTLYTNKVFLNSYQYWQGGDPVGQYRKRTLFPFFDYTPRWSQRLGMYTTPFDEHPAPWQPPVVIAGVPLGALLCSEIGHPELARSDARQSLVIIAAGSEAMFEGDAAGDFNLRAARFRAAENGIPVVRANLLGPSAVVAPDGSVMAQLPYGYDGILRATIELRAITETPYNRYGDLPLWTLLAAIALAAVWVRRSRSEAGMLR